MPERGVTSDIVAVRQADSLSGAEQDWPAGRFLGMLGRAGSVYSSLRAAAHDITVLRNASGYDAVVVRDKILTAAFALVLLPRRRVYYWMSFPFPEEDIIRARAGGNLFKRLLLAARGAISQRLLYRWIVPSARSVFVQSERMREVVKGRSGRSEGLVPVPMGIDEQLVLKLSVADQSIKQGKPVLLGYLGVLDRARRLDFLLDVLSQLQLRTPGRFQLMMIGDASNAEEKQWLLSRVAALGLQEHVLLTGSLPREDAWRQLMTCQVGLSAIPRGELFDVSSPTKTVEYLALGLPVVVNDIPDQEWLIAQTGAGLCCPMDVDKFVASIESLCDRYSDFSGRARSCRSWLLSERGYDRIADLVASRLHQVHSE